MVERAPAEVFSLAEMLCDEMTARGWTTDDVALRMGGRTADAIARDVLVVALLISVQKDGLLIGDGTFAGLARAFDVSEEYLRNIDAGWRRWPDRRSPFEAPEALFGPIFRRSTIHSVDAPTTTGEPS